MHNIYYSILDDSLLCIDGNNNKRIKQDLAIEFLKEVDKTKNNKIYNKGNNLIIRNSKHGYNVVIQGCTQFFLSKYRDLLDNTVKIAKENERKIQEKKHKGKKVSNNLVGKVGVVVAPIVMASMLATTYLKEEDLSNKYSEGIEFEQIDNQIAIKEENNVGEETIQEEPKIEEEEVAEEVVEEVIPTISLDVEDHSMDEEVIQIQSEYKDAFIKYGNKYGISPSVLSGLYTQESHGKGDNKTQIDFSSWKGQIVKVYDFENNKRISVVLSNDTNAYSNVDRVITENDLKDPNKNIEVAAILLSFAADVLDTENVPAILEYYNKGHGNFYKVMAAMEAGTGKTTREVLDNPTDTSFLPYSSACKRGDSNYVCNVMRYVPNKDDGGVYIYRVIDDEVKLISVNVETNKLLDDSYVKNTR